MVDGGNPLGEGERPGVKRVDLLFSLLRTGKTKDLTTPPRNRCSIYLCITVPAIVTGGAVCRLEESGRDFGYLIPRSRSKELLSRLRVSPSPRVSSGVSIFPITTLAKDNLGKGVGYPRLGGT